MTDTNYSNFNKQITEMHKQQQELLDIRLFCEVINVRVASIGR